jgi:hypothetical protein
MKKVLASPITVIFVLLTIFPTAFASEMKEYRNDKDNYSISIPSDWEYRNFIKSKDFSLLALSESHELVYIEKVIGESFPAIKNWSSQDIEKYFQGIKDSNISKTATFKASGETFINNHKLLWIEFSDYENETIIYTIDNHTALYTIGYTYPTLSKEKILPEITNSINSLRFDDISPNWYWIGSDNYFTTYIDTTSISPYKDPVTNTFHKTVTVKLVSSFDTDLSYEQEVFEFKTENGVNYYRILSISEYDSNENFVKSIYHLDKKNPHYNKWSNVTINEILPKITDLL